MPRIKNWKKVGENSWMNKENNSRVRLKTTNWTHKVLIGTPYGNRIVEVEQEGYQTQVVLAEEMGTPLDKKVFDRSEVDAPSELARKIAVDYMKSYPRSGVPDDLDSMTSVL